MASCATAAIGFDLNLRSAFFWKFFALSFVDAFTGAFLDVVADTVERIKVCLLQFVDFVQSTLQVKAFPGEGDF
jgi:hypothetical protein